MTADELYRLSVRCGREMADRTYTAVLGAYVMRIEQGLDECVRVAPSSEIPDHQGWWHGFLGRAAEIIKAIDRRRFDNPSEPKD